MRKIQFGFSYIILIIILFAAYTSFALSASNNNIMSPKIEPKDSHENKQINYTNENTKPNTTSPQYFVPNYHNIHKATTQHEERPSQYNFPLSHSRAPSVTITPNTSNISTHPQQFIKKYHPNNQYTNSNIEKSQSWNHKFLKYRSNPVIQTSINYSKAKYHNQFYSQNYNHYNTLQKYWHNSYYHNWYRNWFLYGFNDGFAYPLVPCFDIESYFNYPMVEWLFTNTPPQQAYYDEYYSQEPALMSDCLVVFPYPGIYFPTDTLRDLLIEASAYPQQLRCNFSNAIITFTTKLQDKFAQTTLDIDGIVLNHYENLQNQAIEISGVVIHDTIASAFEGFLDLDDPDNSIVFVPSGQNPTDEELQSLDQLNSAITNLRSPSDDVP